MIANALQQDAKDGDGDEVAVLQRERKKRIEAAEAFRDGGRDEQAEAERGEAELIDGYLPEQLSDEELAATRRRGGRADRRLRPQEHGPGDGCRDAEVRGRADGKRVSAAVRERLGA